MPYRQNEYKGLEKSREEMLYEKLKLRKWVRHYDDTLFSKFKSSIGVGCKYITIAKLLWYTSVSSGDIKVLKGKYAKKLYKHIKRKRKEEEKEQERLEREKIIGEINRSA